MLSQHKHKSSKFEKIPSKHAGHGHKELKRALSVRVRNYECTERARQELMRTLSMCTIN
jgi:hypothetical protein